MEPFPSLWLRVFLEEFYNGPSGIDAHRRLPRNLGPTWVGVIAGPRVSSLGDDVGNHLGTISAALKVEAFYRCAVVWNGLGNNCYQRRRVETASI